MKYVSRSNVLTIALFIIVGCLDVKAQNMDKDKIIKYIQENLSSKTKIIEEDGVKKIKNRYVDYTYKAPVNEIDKNSISLFLSQDRRLSDRSAVHIKCEEKKDAVRMSEQEDLPRKNCWKKKKYYQKDWRLGGSSHNVVISIGTTGSASGAKDAFKYLISKVSKKESITSSEGSEGMRTIEVRRKSGVFKTEVSLNGVVKIDMIVDSGASEVRISPDVASTIIRSGTVEESDWLDSRTYVFADGSRAESKRFNLDTIKIGEYTINNVAVSISEDIESPLLLGQNVLSRLGEVTLDYDNSKIIIE